MSDRTHDPVLVEEVLALIPAESRLVIDCTIGGGGHAEAIMNKLGNEAELTGFDRDVAALAIAGKQLEKFGTRVKLVHDSYARMDAHLPASTTGNVDFILMDLGLSSMQLEKSGRGFSFQQASEPLDLRFDASSGVPASEKILESQVEELTKVLREYGELSGAGRIATRIHEAAERNELNNVGDLVGIANSLAHGEKRNQFLAKIWQALRIWVNDELGEVQKGLESAEKNLKAGGVLAVISFHSLEDRMVKNFLNTQEDPCTCPKGLPQCVCGAVPTMKRLTRKAIKPSEAEVRDNPRSRSARLRAAAKLRVN